MPSVKRHAKCFSCSRRGFVPCLLQLAREKLDAAAPLLLASWVMEEDSELDGSAARSARLRSFPSARFCFHMFGKDPHLDDASPEGLFWPLPQGATALFRLLSVRSPRLLLEAFASRNYSRPTQRIRFRCCAPTLSRSTCFHPCVVEVGLSVQVVCFFLAGVGGEEGAEQQRAQRLLRAKVRASPFDPPIRSSSRGERPRPSTAATQCRLRCVQHSESEEWMRLYLLSQTQNVALRRAASPQLFEALAGQAEELLKQVRRNAQRKGLSSPLQVSRRSVQKAGLLKLTSRSCVERRRTNFCRRPWRLPENARLKRGGFF